MDVFLPGESQEQGSLVGGLPSMGLHRVGHDWSDLAAAAAVDVFILEKEFKNLGLLGNLEPFNTTLWSNCILDMNFECLNLYISDAVKQ